MQLLVVGEKVRANALITAASSSEALDFARTYEYDAVLIRGEYSTASSLIRILRDEKVTTPIIVVCGKTEDAAALLDKGADECIREPVEDRELQARIRAVVRRSHGHACSVIKTGSLAVDIAARRVHMKGEEVHLTGKEYETLQYLALRRGKTVSREQMLSAFYPDGETLLNVISQYVMKIRRKLAKVDQRCYIRTIIRNGYVFE